MVGLRLFVSNRLEILADQIGDVLRTPLQSPMEEEVVVVQSRGMERWLSTELALRHGICANYRFPFPNTFLDDVFQSVLGHFPERSTYDPQILVWKIMGLLPLLVEEASFKEVKRYLGSPAEPLRVFQLSERIADLFDQYLVFRPEMMLQWEKTNKGDWQGELWRALTKQETEPHRARLARDFYKKTEALSGASKDPLLGLPSRVSVFGISALPRFHVEIFSRIAAFIEVNLFLMNPSEAYWGDIVSDWEMKRLMDRERDPDRSPEDLHLDRGNSLLASMGMMGRDFFNLIHACDCQELPQFKDPGEGSMLASVQSDILFLRERGIGPWQRTKSLADDRSIQIHSCHSPMREIEVLHDQLLHLFEKDPALLPKDVLVMAPNIEDYAPYIQAVFDIPKDGGPSFPFSIADRGVRQENESVEAFLALLSLHDSRMGASEVLGFLEYGVVRRTFGLTASDLDTVRQWVTDTGIRWGIDARSREKWGLPPFEENTWTAGVNRLLMGYAMPGHEEKMFRGILPYDHVEGDVTLLLGRFIQFCTYLFDCIRDLDRQRTLKAWGRVLGELTAHFFVLDREADHDLQVLRRIFQDLEALEDRWHIDGEFEFEVIQSYLNHQLEKKSYGFGFISGGITFCSMLPMRSIPFRIVCLVGMNGDAYPRESRPLGFDLMAQEPKPGDRSRRNDDRYLFLETILSARETLYMSYVGQSIRDNTAVPPSVLVSEMLDYGERAFEGPTGDIREQIFTQHRLQAFSPEYFKEDSPLFSYSKPNLDAAERATGGRSGQPAPFISTGLSSPEEKWRRIDVSQLCAFYANPVQFFFKERLGVAYDDGRVLLEDREHFHVEGLDKYLLQKRLVEIAFSGGRPWDYYDMARASGILPHGSVGKCVFDRLCMHLESFKEKTVPYLESQSLEPVTVNGRISDFHLVGHVSSMYPAGRVFYRYAKLTPRDHVMTWLTHLILQSVNLDGFSGNSYLIGLEAEKKEETWICWRYCPVAESVEILSALLDTYWDGLARPVSFFPRTSWEYASHLLERGKSREQALEKAIQVWVGNAFMPGGGESQNAYYERSFRSGPPLDAPFEALAVQVLGPLLGHREQVGEGEEVEA